MIQQRQYFARRREQNQQNANPAQVRQTVDSFRHLQAPPADNGVDRRPGEQVPPVSIDFLPLANPSAIDSLLSELRRPKRPRLHEPRRDRRGSPQRVRGEPVQDLSLDVSNDIRIFDADVEKTHQYRRRVLPQGFLNSQTTVHHRKRGGHSIRGRRVRGHLRGAILGKRSWHGRNCNAMEAKIAHRKHNASSPRLQRDEIVDMEKESWAPPASFHKEHRQELRSPRRKRHYSPSSRFRSPTSSPLDDRALIGQFDDDEIVEATLSSDGHRSAYRDFLLGVSPNAPKESKTRELTTQNLASTFTAISPRFPPVTVDSDSLSSLERYRSAKKENKVEQFESLLSKEHITNDQFSADLEEIERKLLNLPDRDVPFMSRSTKVSNLQKPSFDSHRTTSLVDSKLQPLKTSTKRSSVPMCLTDASRAKVNQSLRNLPSPSRPAPLDKDRGMDSEGTLRLEAENPPTSRSALVNSMEVSVGSGAENPITTAADGVPSAK